LAKAPDDVAQKLATCIDREVLLMALLKPRDDPKVALLILKKKHKPWARLTSPSFSHRLSAQVLR